MDSLAVLLTALASSAAQGFGAELWEGLRAALRRPRGGLETDKGAEASALEALVETPSDPAAAETLRDVIEERASVDAEFRDTVAAWADEARRALGMASPGPGLPESRTGSFHLTIGDVTHHHYYR